MDLEVIFFAAAAPHSISTTSKTKQANKNTNKHPSADPKWPQQARPIQDPSNNKLAIPLDHIELTKGVVHQAECHAPGSKAPSKHCPPEFQLDLYWYTQTEGCRKNYHFSLQQFNYSKVAHHPVYKKEFFYYKTDSQTDLRPTMKSTHLRKKKKQRIKFAKQLTKEKLSVPTYVNADDFSHACKLLPRQSIWDTWKTQPRMVVYVCMSPERRCWCSDPAMERRSSPQTKGRCSPETKGHWPRWNHWVVPSTRTPVCTTPGTGWYPPGLTGPGVTNYGSNLFYFCKTIFWRYLSSDYP